MEVEKFFGCYLLYSLNEKYKGRTYIGFTVDPNRRIKQHNRGLKAGGAWKTNNKGPWDMVLIVHGFPTDVAALRFEWAWQNPLKSRRLRHVSKKLPRENALKYSFRVMSEMLRVGPWNRLPLTVQWLNITYKQDFDVSKLPPLHIPICVGPIVPQKVKDIKEEEVLKFCFLCHQVVTKDKRFICFSKDCKEAFHVICLGKKIVSSHSEKNRFLLPVDGICPNCNASMLWGDVVRYVSGCYQKNQQIASEAPFRENNDQKSDSESHKVREAEFERKTNYQHLEALNHKHLVHNVEKFECSICFSDVDVGEGVTLQECLHNFCRECLASTIKFSEAVTVKCPFQNDDHKCEFQLREREVKSLVTPEIFEKYLQKSIALAESQAQNSFHCKTPDCSGWCLFEDAVNFFFCLVCKQTNCLTCDAIHEGMNCREYQDDVALKSGNNEEAKKTKEYLQNMLENGKAMRCPECTVIIIKKGGCKKMTCSICYKRFVWPYKEPHWEPRQHYRHRNIHADLQSFSSQHHASSFSPDLQQNSSVSLDHSDPTSSILEYYRQQKLFQQERRRHHRQSRKRHQSAFWQQTWKLPNLGNSSRQFLSSDVSFTLSGQGRMPSALGQREQRRLKRKNKREEAIRKRLKKAEEKNKQTIQMYNDISKAGPAGATRLLSIDMSGHQPTAPVTSANLVQEMVQQNAASANMLKVKLVKSEISMMPAESEAQGKFH